jgi:hypothetical protein
VIVAELLTPTGTKVAQLDATECTATVTREINGAFELRLEYPIPPSGKYGFDKSEHLKSYKNLVRIKDLSTGEQNTFTILESGVEKTGGGKQVATVYGEHSAISALNTRIFAKSRDYKATSASAVLADILAYVPGWSAGDGSLTEKVSLYISYESCMSALQRLLSACGGEYDMSESAGTISVVKALGVSNYSHLRYDKNLRSIRRTFYSRDVVNKMYGIGGGSPPITIAGARHGVSSYDSNTGLITTQGNRVVAEEASWNGYKAHFVTGIHKGYSYTIFESSPGESGDTILISSSLDVEAGDKFTIQTSDGLPVDYISAAASEAAYGLAEGAYKNELFIDATNLVEVPALDGSYISGRCEKWTKEAPSGILLESTNPATRNYGEKSQIVYGYAEGAGISQSVSVLSGKYYNCQAWVYVVAGTVRFQVSDGISTWYASKNSSGWQRFSIVEQAASDSLLVKVIQEGGQDSTFVVDGVQVTEGILNRSFDPNTNHNGLWGEAYNQLIKLKDPRIEYQVDFVDLHSSDPLRYPTDKIGIGDIVKVYDDELSISDLSARVKRQSVNVFQPENSQYIVNNL